MPRATSPLPFLVRPVPEPRARPHRDRIWDLSPNLHCSVVGTCLTFGEIRQLFVKLDEPDARSASDHALHGRAVLAAGRRDLAGKLLNKALDSKHAPHLKRYAQAKSANEVLALWRSDFERGDIPGAYWAALTHPAADRTVVRTVFEEVHMLSHRVGRSNRADLARLSELETALDAGAEKAARQEERLRRAADEKTALVRRLEELESDRRAPAAVPAAVDAGVREDAVQTAAAERARNAALSAKLVELGRSLEAGQKAAAALERRNAELAAEVAALERALAALSEPATAEPALETLSGLTLLYVGGRPRLVDHVRQWAARHGALVLDHDGGIEQATSLLAGLVARANAAFVPVDCVSHLAMAQVKRLCRDADKPFVPLRSASVGTFIAAAAALADGIGGAAERRA